MIELFIGNERVVLKGSEVIAPTYQAFDIAELTKIKFDFTNTFTLPFCDVNDRIFQNAFRVQSQSTKRYLANSCKLIIGGSELISDGVAEYIGSSDAGYQIVCYSLPLDFFNDIAPKTIRDLDYTGYSHLNTIATVISSQTRTDKYIYPLIDWHTDSPNNFIKSDTRLIDVRYMMPCLFYHELLTKIFTEAGYTLVNNTENNDFFDSYDLALTTDNKNNYLLNLAQGGELTNVFTILVGGMYKIYFTGFDNDFINGEDRLVEFREDDYSFDFLAGYQFNQILNLQFIQPLADEVYEFKVRFNATFDGDTATVFAFDFLIIESDPDQTVFTLADVAFQQSIAIISRNEETYNVSSFVNCNKNKRYFWAIQMRRAFTLTPIFIISDVLFNLEQTVRVVKDYVPDIKQTDLIKNYLQLTGSVITYNSYTKVFTIERFDKVIENKAVAKDWTNKIYDNSKKPSIKHRVGNYGVSNEFKYAEDENDLKPINADGFISSTNQNLNKEFQVLELLFAATMMVNRLSNLNIPNIKSFENKNAEIDLSGQQVVISLGSKFIGEIVPRILLVRRETLDVLNPVGFTNGANTVSSNQVALAHFIDLSQTSNLGFAANILNHFYQWLQSILNDTIVVEQELKLLASDVSADNLDRLIPVYFQQHNAYFYVNIINNFVENKKTKAQLIKI
jgi:hypothetical protein